MNQSPNEPRAISDAFYATRADVIERLREASELYRRSRAERLALMKTASDLGVPVRQIAEITGDGHSAVAKWISRSRAAAQTEDVAPTSR